MINRASFFFDDESDSPGEEMPFDETLVQNWITKNALVTRTKIKSLVAEIDFNKPCDIEFGIPLDIPA